MPDKNTYPVHMKKGSNYSGYNFFGSGGTVDIGTLNVTTNNSGFYGKVITVKDSNDVTVNTGTFSNQGTATISVIGIGYYFVSITAYGTTITQEVAVTATAEYNVALNSDTILGAWINKGGLDYTDYADFSEVEADEEAVRRLMTIHASVDYLAECGSATDSLVLSIINSDICAKWINLRDYALDTLYANTYIASMMDTADKYFYGEWVITDNTTTPPTWGAKGNVPVMTANDAPYGTASASDEKDNTTPAWKAFDGDITTTWQVYMKSMPWIQYKFTNPVIVKRVSVYETQGGNGSSAGVKYYNLWLSNDGTTWTKFNNIFGAITTDINRWYTANINNNNAYLYARLEIDGTIAAYWGTREIQFYGRELRESVPTMTSNTAPYGEVLTSSNTTSTPYKAFDGDNSTEGGQTVGDDIGRFIYRFTSPICAKYFYYRDKSSLGGNQQNSTFKIQASNDGSAWTDLTDSYSISASSITEMGQVIDNDNSYLYYALTYSKCTYIDGNNNKQCWITTLQFYGLNYSEYDWDAEHPRHYLYDHGLKFNSSIFNWDDSRPNAYEYRSDEVYLKSTQQNSGSIYYERTSFGEKLDTTSYKTVRVVLGSESYSSNNESPAIVINDTAGTAGTQSSCYLIKVKNGALDITSVNGNYWVVFVIYLYNDYGSTTEFWLE